MRKTLAVAALMILGVSSTPSFQTRMIEYDIDGTAKYANVTWNTGSGGTEQKQVKFPFHEEFLAPAGTLAYISAQKTVVKRDVLGRLEVESDGVQGTVHVVIRINQHVASEATADAPFGIAKTGVKVE